MGFKTVSEYVQTIDPAGLLFSKVKLVGVTAPAKQKLFLHIKEKWGDPEGRKDGLLSKDLDPKKYGLNWLQQLWPIAKAFPVKEVGEELLRTRLKYRLSECEGETTQNKINFGDLMAVRWENKLYGKKELKAMGKSM